MSTETVAALFGEAIYLLIILISVLMIPGLIVGLLVSMFQAATQINESSLSFIPKLFITFAVLGYAGPWMLKLLISYMDSLLSSIPYWLG